MSLFDLRAGYDSLHQELEGKPSRYNKPPEVIRGSFTQIEVPATEKPSLAQEMNDELPTFADLVEDDQASGQHPWSWIGYLFQFPKAVLFCYCRVKRHRYF